MGLIKVAEISIDKLEDRKTVKRPERRRLKDHQRMSCRVHEGTEGISFNERPCLHPYDCAGGKSGSKEVR